LARWLTCNLGHTSFKLDREATTATIRMVCLGKKVPPYRRELERRVSVSDLEACYGAI
jgi:hypothetical protein